MTQAICVVIAPPSGTKTRLCHKANSLVIKFLLGLALFASDFSPAVSLVDEHSQMNLNSETSRIQAVFSALTSRATMDHSMTCQVINYDLINLQNDTWSTFLLLFLPFSMKSLKMKVNEVVWDCRLSQQQSEDSGFG